MQTKTFLSLSFPYYWKIIGRQYCYQRYRNLGKAFVKYDKSNSGQDGKMEALGKQLAIPKVFEAKWLLPESFLNLIQDGCVLLDALMLTG